ncbi:unnamed protein product [Boreogadus saida]
MITTVWAVSTNENEYSGDMTAGPLAACRCSTVLGGSPRVVLGTGAGEGGVLGWREMDTLRDCPPGQSSSDYGCHAGLQFISPLYFVSFVLTAQFVLINVVVAVLMKHLDDSNKEAQEDAEMDAEIELELAQGGLCCMTGGLGAIAGTTGASVGGGGSGGGGGGGRGGGGGPGAGMMMMMGQGGPPPGGAGGGPVALRGGGGGGGGAGGGGGGGGGGGSTQYEAQRHRRCRLYSPAQESQWLDSVSLLIKDSLEGELIDNLSGSVFHHYCPLPTCRDCRAHSQEIRLAEVEQASLMSEQMSDKSSLALPDDLSLDEYSMYQLLLPDPPSQRGGSSCPSPEEQREVGSRGGSDPVSPDSSGGEEGLRWRLEEGLLPRSAPFSLGRSGAAWHANAGLTETQELIEDLEWLNVDSSQALKRTRGSSKNLRNPRQAHCGGTIFGLHLPLIPPEQNSLSSH